MCLGEPLRLGHRPTYAVCVAMTFYILTLVTEHRLQPTLPTSAQPTPPPNSSFALFV